MNNIEKGKIAENYAIKFLRENNYKIICTNYRFRRFGEIDIIAGESEYICFIEVKARSSNRFGYPSEAVNYIKRNRIKNTASYYLAENKIRDAKVRFDVVEVFFNASDNDVKINLIKNAF
ncbi:MAG TPA: YraN family protein [Clostridiaceae bacterium]|nr:YraN family protein [Clostridiaceae bacterium]